MHILQLYSGQVVTSGDFIYRIEQPAHGLQRLPGVRVENHDLLAMLDMSALMMPDILILHHVSDPDLLPVISQRKQLGKLTVYELADNFRASQSHDDSHESKFREYHFIMEEMMRRCDAVQTTSVALQKEFGKFNKTFLQFPNFVREVRTKVNCKKENDTFVVGWGGSVRHYTDLQHFAGAITAWIKRNPDAVFAIMGSKKIAGLFREIPSLQFRHSRGGSLNAYLNFIDTLDVGIAPLLPSAFNACRSDVKYLEYASRSVCPLCARYGPYLNTGVDDESILYFDSAAELKKQLTHLKRRRRHRQSIAQNAGEWVTQNRLDIPEIWQHRLDSYRGLMRKNKITENNDAAIPTEHWSQTVAGILARAVQCRRPEEALVLVADAERIAPQSYQVYYFRGWLQTQLSAYTDAVLSLKKALKLQPESIRTLQLLTQVQMLQMDLEGSWQTFARLRELLPETPASKRIAHTISRLNQLRKLVAI